MIRFAASAVGLLGLVPLASAAPCEEEVTATDVTAAVETAEGAFAAADADRFRAAMATLDSLLPCVGEPVTRQLAASIHRMHGFQAFIDRDDTRLDEAFVAARVVEPGYRFPATVLPDGHPMRSRYDEASADPGASEPMPEPADGYIYLDGREEEKRPSSRPIVLQLFRDDGSIVESAYLWPGEALPSYPIAKARAKGPNWPLLASGLVLMGASGGLFAWAGLTKAEYTDPHDPPPYEDGEALVRRNRTLVIAGGATGAAGLGLGVTAFAVGRW